MGETEVDASGITVLMISVPYHEGELLSDLLDQVITQRGNVIHVEVHVLLGDLTSLAESHYQWEGNCSASDSSFLPPTTLNGLDPDPGPFPDVERPNPLRAVNFVTTYGHEVDFHRVHVHWDFPHRLSCVGVEENFPAPAELSGLIHRLADPNLVVDHHDRDQGSVWSHGRFQVGHRYQSVLLNRQVSYIKALIFQNTTRIQNTFVFDLGCYDVFLTGFVKPGNTFN